MPELLDLELLTMQSLDFSRIIRNCISRTCTLGRMQNIYNANRVWAKIPDVQFCGKYRAAFAMPNAD